MTTLNILIGLFILSIVIVPIALYKRWLSPRFRLIETRYSYGQSSYTPQVRLRGIWFNIVYCPVNSKYTVMAEINFNVDNIDPHDAVVLIEQFKIAGNYAILSNKKLESNQKSIVIEEQIIN